MANEKQEQVGRRRRKRQGEDEEERRSQLGEPFKAKTTQNSNARFIIIIIIIIILTGSMMGFPEALQLDNHALRGWVILTRIPSLDTWATSTSVPIGNDPVGAEARSLFFFSK